MRLFLNIRKGINRWFNDLIKLKKSPREIATGLAIGLFISAMFTPGLNILLALFAIAFFRVNKLAIFAGLAVLNPFVATGIYVASLKLGIVITGAPPIDLPLNVFNIYIIKYVFQNYLAPFYIGNVILSAAIALTGYFLMYYLVREYYKKRE